MPIYEYACKKCGEFETMQKITDPPLTRCPTCSGRVNKLISNTSFQLKGSGWYVTDYARKDAGKSREKGTAGEAKSEAKSEKPASSEKPTSGSSTQTAAA
ncbi:zinc ribbon domain-containing protein [Candidatus Binatia bacterium]|nr:zinc ribbon domain-containing protein [Candidatus Binatia bacterium]